MRMTRASYGCWQQHSWVAAPQFIYSSCICTSSPCSNSLPTHGCWQQCGWNQLTLSHVGLHCTAVLCCAVMFCVVASVVHRLTAL